MTYYFPSCRFTQASPSASRKIQEYLAQRHGIASVGCCRPGHKSLEEGDTALTICMSCAAICGENRPHARVENIFEFLSRDEGFQWPDYHGEKMTVQDCWRAQGNTALQDAVRTILRKLHVETVEMPENRDQSTFCGTFRFQPVRKQNLDIAPRYFGNMTDKLDLCPEDEQHRRLVEHAKRYPVSKVVCTCNSCLQGVKQAGAQGIHLMELLFPETQ